MRTQSTLRSSSGFTLIELLVVLTVVVGLLLPAVQKVYETADRMQQTRLEAFGHALGQAATEVENSALDLQAELDTAAQAGDLSDAVDLEGFQEDFRAHAVHLKTLSIELQA